MMLRVSSLPAPRWLRTLLASALLGLPLYASCTPSEDTEPYVPSSEGAVQPGGDGAVLPEAEACQRIAAAEDEARDRLGCDAPERAACPSYIRPAGGSGCYEYRKASVEGCEAAYADAESCAFAPCIVVAVENAALRTCEQSGVGGARTGGAGGGEAVGGNPGSAGASVTTGGAAGSDAGAGGAAAGPANGGAGGA